MLPTLRPDKIVVATSWFKVVKPGQVVVFRHGKIEKIKRVKDIRNSRIFLIGDNLRYSDDSRVFGWLPLENVIAKVIWPRL
jgi:phage repressor protein C with HTH and peptisase S24 domain